jgi:RNA recognition motif-containing protein
MPDTDAARAMQALNGTNFEGRDLKVSEAQAKERGGGGRNGPRRY